MNELKIRVFAFPALVITLASVVLSLSYDVQAFRQLGAGLWLIGIVSVIWIFITTIYSAQTIINQSYTVLIKEMKHLTKDQFLALGIKFPHIRIKLGAIKPIEFFEDTNATYEQFDFYIRTSNDRQISPLRDWRTTERPARIWHEITDHLIKFGYVQRASSSGSHSHLWLFQSYSKLREMYFKPDLVNMNETEAQL